MGCKFTKAILGVVLPLGAFAVVYAKTVELIKRPFNWPTEACVRCGSMSDESILRREG